MADNITSVKIYYCFQKICCDYYYEIKKYERAKQIERGQKLEEIRVNLRGETEPKNADDADDDVDENYMNLELGCHSNISDRCFARHSRDEGNDYYASRSRRKQFIHLLLLG